MVKQREGHRIIMTEIANIRIGKDQCPNCGLPQYRWKRRKDWTCCSTDCTTNYWNNHVIVKSWQDLREKVFDRDNNKCVQCDNNNTLDLQADHIKPIALGGDQWDINNIQTLCDTCHKIKTKQDMKSIAELRRTEKKLSNGQQKLK